MSDSLIREAVRKLAGTQFSDEVFVLEATVTSVQIETRTCTCETIGGKGVTDIENVRLMAEVEDGFLIIPEIGSTVIVSYAKNLSPYISMFSNVNKVLAVVGNSSLEIIDGAITFNDGSFGGLIKIEDLVTKLNNLENLLNNLITLYNLHTHTSNGTPTTSTESGSLTPTVRADIENDSITHG